MRSAPAARPRRCSGSSSRPARGCSSVGRGGAHGWRSGRLLRALPLLPRRVEPPRARRRGPGRDRDDPARGRRRGGRGARQPGNGRGGRTRLARRRARRRGAAQARPRPGCGSSAGLRSRGRGSLRASSSRRTCPPRFAATCGSRSGEAEHRQVTAASLSSRGARLCSRRGGPEAVSLSCSLSRPRPLLPPDVGSLGPRGSNPIDYSMGSWTTAGEPTSKSAVDGDVDVRPPR